jgi:hypothetical protein
LLILKRLPPLSRLILARLPPLFGVILQRLRPLFESGSIADRKPAAPVWV